MMEENVLTIIKHDHEKTSQEIEKLEAAKTEGPAAENRIYVAMQEELLGHMHAEEDLVYPLIKTEEKELIRDALQEHDEIRSALKKLSKGMIGDDAWLMELKKMKQKIEHHVKDEEGPIFTAIQKVADTATLKDLGTRFKREEKAGLKAST